MSNAKALVLVLWLFLLFAALTFADTIKQHLSKRKAERILSHAKFYLHATTASYLRATCKRDWSALQLLTEKILEVRNG